jgi:hypothetical protein
LEIGRVGVATGLGKGGGSEAGYREGEGVQTQLLGISNDLVF